MPLPVPDVKFNDGLPKLPVSTWESYKQLSDLSVDSNKQYGIDQNINLYNPQYIVDECFVTNLGTFFEDWWDITQAGVPPKELQYEPPPANIGPAAQSLVDNLCQRTGSSRKDICRRIAHNLNLVGNIKKFAALGSEKAVASKNKNSKKKISKKQKSKKRERTPDIEDEDYQAIGEEDSDQNEQPELYDEDKLGESGEEED